MNCELMTTGRYTNTAVSTADPSVWASMMDSMAHGGRHDAISEGQTRKTSMKTDLFVIKLDKN